MTKKQKIICKNNFKNSNKAKRKAELNEKLAKWIRTSINRTDWRDG
jgi:hypothetical protein